jgi:T4 RnlA family RNA ligase
MLYNDLMKLVSKNDGMFYFRDEVSPFDGYTYRHFLYRLISYLKYRTEPVAKEARGILFRLESDPILVSRPFEKFFNLHELHNNGDDPDISKIIRLENKFDGSLIKTYLDYNGVLRFASKGSIFSEHSIAAEKIFEKFDDKFKNEIYHFTKNGFTVLFEYVSPEHQIIIHYEVPELHLLAVRNNTTGKYLNISTLNYIDVNIEEELSKVYESKKPDFEGYVAVFEDGFRFKIKTEYYCQLHRAKDTINTLDNLVECIIDEQIDDLLIIFKDKPITLERIKKVSDIVTKLYNGIIVKTEEFYERNKNLERKDYAILIQQEDSNLLPVAMNLYLNKKPEYKKLFLTKYLPFVEEQLGE